MASGSVAAISAFIEGAPPGELADVVNDIKNLTSSQPTLLAGAKAAFQKYNEEQFTVTKLPSDGQEVIISPYNCSGDGRYYDVEQGKSWAFDHTTQKASDVQPYTSESQHRDLITSLSKSFTLHATEHYPTSTTAVIPSSSSSSAAAEDSLTLLLVSSRYSPANFWNGRLRTHYTYHPATATLSGTLKCDVHYYEDGNVRLTTHKQLDGVSVGGGGGSGGGNAAAGAGEVVREIARVEKRWQEELNRGFTQLSEGSFKGLRRQLPVTRQKVEWEKVGSLRVGREIGGVRR